jgi:hypothetical protein
MTSCSNTVGQGAYTLRIQLAYQQDAILRTKVLAINYLADLLI